MKIVIDGRIINSTTGRYVERLLTYLEKIDHENTYVVLVPSKDKDYWVPTQPNFSVETCDAANFSLAEQITFKQQLDALKPDLVHFCMPQQPVLYCGKKVTTIHDLSQLRFYNPDKNWFVYRFKQLVGWFVFKHVIRSSVALITDSRYSEQDIVAFSPVAASKITTIYLSADPLHEGPSVPYAATPSRFLLYVGQQSTHKNIPRLMEAHQKLLATYPDLHLLLVGRLNANAKRMQQLARDKGYANIVFTGFVPDEQLAWLYEHAQAYILPSLAEGFGMPGLEAMQHSAPVVSSNATCLPEVFGEAAIYFDPTNSDDMAHSIGIILDSPELREELVKNGKERLELYSWQRMAEETLSVYKSVGP